MTSKSIMETTSQYEMADLVSILIPTYNREKYIAETIESALLQTYDNIEIIVVDNCSTDQSWEIIKNAANKNPKLKIYQNTSNIGPVKNWIKCLSHAKGKYSKILWSDDLIAPDFIKKTHAQMLETEDVGFSITGTVIFQDKNNKETGELFYNENPTGIYSTESFINFSILNGLNRILPVSPGCALFKTTDLIENLLENIPNSIGSDFSMHAIGNDLLIYLLTAKKYKNFGIINENLSYFRSHETSITVQSNPLKLFVLYNIAKAYFLASNNIENKNFNDMLKLNIENHDLSIFGIQKLSDFYPPNL